MRFERTDSFKADYRRLSESDKATFRTAAQSFNEACDRFVDDPESGCPAALHVKKVRGAKGVWEMTWSFSGPGGRATWEWIAVEAEAGGRLERLRAVGRLRAGDHSLFNRP